MPFECRGGDGSHQFGPWDPERIEAGTIDIRISAPRSSLPVSARRVLLAAAVVAGLVSIRFVLIGAWPVLLFSLLDIGGLAVALILFGRSQPQRERLLIDREKIALVRYDASGRSATSTLPTFWTRVETVSRSEVDCSLYLVFQQRRVAVARCLSDAERRALAPQINQALGKCRS